MNGVVYTATGPVYVEQARTAIGSLRRWNPDLAVAIFTDDPASFAGIADVVTPVQPRSLPREQRMLPRLECLQQSPFRRTLAMDTDTVVMGQIGEVFDVLDRVSVGICHGHQRAKRFAAALAEDKADPAIPYAFAPVQGGVILYDDAEGKRFVDDVVAAYQHKQYIDDQVSMREVLWEADYRFAFLGPEYNLHQLNLLDRWDQADFAVAWPKVFHTVNLKHLLSPDEIDRLLLPVATRAEAHRVAQLEAGSTRVGPPPPDGSAPGGAARLLARARSRERHWRARRRLLRRIKDGETSDRQ